LQIVTTALVSLGGGGAIVWGFSNFLGKVWASRIMEKEKASYARDLDAIRHQFQLEQKQMSVVFENQKSSFTNIIKAMDKAILALEQSWDDEWEPLPDKDYNKFHAVVVEEFLLTGADGEKALNLFSSVLSNTVAVYEVDYIPNDRSLRECYQQLRFLSERIREYFRFRVGLPGRGQPLVDIAVFGGRSLLDEYFKFDEDYSSSPLASKERQSTEQWIVKGYTNLKELKERLKDMVTRIELSDEESSEWRFKQALEARYYLDILANEAPKS
jgi:hypothetical protein